MKPAFDDQLIEGIWSRLNSTPCDVNPVVSRRPPYLQIVRRFVYHAAHYVWSSNFSKNYPWTYGHVPDRDRCKISCWCGCSSIDESPCRSRRQTTDLSSNVYCWLVSVEGWEFDGINDDDVRTLFLFHHTISERSWVWRQVMKFWVVV